MGDTVDTDTVDTTAVLTDTTAARGPLMPPPKLPLLPPLKPKLMPMLTTDTAVDTDTVDTVMADMDTDTVMANKDIMVELLLKQTNKQTNPLNINCQDQVTRNSFNLATMQIFPPPLFFLKPENSLFFPIELES